MGARQTKIEGTFLPETHTISVPGSRFTIVGGKPLDCGKNVDAQDPRSPNICRTPVSIFSLSHPRTESEPNAKVSNTESAVGQLRKRFFKGFSYNLNDPRSPGCLFNRTPLSFDDSQDKVLNLDDTFADLFSETQSKSLIQDQHKVAEIIEHSTNNRVEIVDFEQPKEFIDSEILNEVHADVVEQADESVDNSIDNSFSVSKVNDLPHSPLLPLTPKIVQDEIDPRSPTIGVDRTPIIFNDDEDESHESVLLESILATLSLNMSDGSICSIGASNRNSSSPRQGVEPNKTDRQGQLFRKITHKRMRRSHANGKIPLATRRTPKVGLMSPHSGLENCENGVPTLSIDKIKFKKNGLQDNSIRRTPLSCIKNSGNFH